MNKLTSLFGARASAWFGGLTGVAAVLAGILYWAGAFGGRDAGLPNSEDLAALVRPASYKIALASRCVETTDSTLISREPG